MELDGVVEEIGRKVKYLVRISEVGFQWPHQHAA